MMMESIPPLQRAHSPHHSTERSNVASVFVQADDFSGAAEVGYCFVQHGLSAQVLLGTGTAPGTHDGGASSAGHAAPTWWSLIRTPAGLPKPPPRRW